MVPLHIHHRGRINAPLASFMRRSLLLPGRHQWRPYGYGGAGYPGAINGAPAYPPQGAHSCAPGFVYASVASFMRPWLIIARAPSMAPLQIYIRAR